MRNFLILLLFITSTTRAEEPAKPLVFRGKTLVQWRADLHSTQPGIRSRAATALGLGPFGKAAVPFLLEARKDSDADVKQSVLASLAELGPTAPDAAPALVPEIEIRPSRFGSISRRPIDVSRITTSSIPLLLNRVRHDPDLANESAHREFLNGVDRSAIPLLRNALRDSCWHIRAAAASALGTMGNDAASAVPELLQALKDDNANVRSAAIAALGRTRSRHSVVPSLAQLLSGDDVIQAAYALTRQGSEGMAALRQAYYGGSHEQRFIVLFCLNGAEADALPLLLDGLGHPEGHLRGMAARGIAASWIAVDRDLPRLIAALEDGNANVRASMISTLGQVVPPRREGVLAIARMLTDQDVEVRAAAAVVFRQLGRFAQPGVPLLFKALRHREPNIRSLAVELLGQTAPAHHDVVLALCEALKDRSDSVRLSAMVALGNFGPEVRGLSRTDGPADSARRTEIVVPALLVCLRDRSAYVRVFAADALLKIGYHSDAIVRQLGQEVLDPWQRLLRLPGSTARQTAAGILQRLGRKAAPALPHLMLTLYDDDYTPIETLGAMGPAAHKALPALERMLDSSFGDAVRGRAALALTQLGEDGLGILRTALAQQDERLTLSVLLGVRPAGRAARGLRPDVLRLTQEPNSGVRHAAICTLEAIGARGEDVRGVLLRALRDESEGVREAACQVLVAMGPEGKDAIPALIESLLHRSADHRRTAVEGLGQIDPGDRQAFPALVETLTDPDETVRKAVVEALGKAGHPALFALRNACRDRGESVRVAAACALYRIDGYRDEAGRVLRSVMLDGKEDVVRVEACKALWKHERTPEVVPVLAQLLREDGARSFAKNALCELDGALDDVRAFVRPLLKHELRAVRAAAWCVLEKTSPELTTALVNAR